MPTDPDDPTRERWPRDAGSPAADELYPQVGSPRRDTAAARAEPEWWDMAQESGAGIERAAADEPAPGVTRPRRKRATRAAGPAGGSGPDIPVPRVTDAPAAASGLQSGGPESTRGARGSAPQGAAEAASGPELARAVIDAALTKRREAARNPRRNTGEGSGKRLRGYSGPGPDPRDPQLFGAVLGRLMKARGWEKPKAEATVFGAWEKVVGAEIANHSRPIKLDDGVLTVEAESTAWATQLRMLAAGLLRSIAAEVGHNVVTKLNIHGPAAPSWAKGPRRVQGRGPRDTYG